ncbi:hypothetical protein V1512DRAFT_267455 [Lipomyces arxii]|uniref:uncharacterized protein n=1 Tax=Lipomyces arxii TaxID=56418 RepID=UPI0034CD8624
MAGDAYSHVSGGSLKIKGGKVHKKKKLRNQSEDENKKNEHQLQNMTEAERRFEEIQKKRMEKVLEKKALKSHKEEVDEYNKYLSTLSEHNDMPKIGPG